MLARWVRYERRWRETVDKRSEGRKVKTNTKERESGIEERESSDKLLHTQSGGRNRFREPFTVRALERRGQELVEREN